jgi:hypothetical protein
MEATMQAAGATVFRGGDYDRWDLEIRGGLLGTARLRLAVEEHGSGRQLVRLRCWPRCSPAGVTAGGSLGALSGWAAFDHAWAAAALLGALAVLIAAEVLLACAGSLALLLRGARVRWGVPVPRRSPGARADPPPRLASGAGSGGQAAAGGRGWPAAAPVVRRVFVRRGAWPD